MNEAYLNERVQASVTELFKVQREEEESQRLSIAELVREGARIMLETALEVELEEFLGRMRYQRGRRKRQGYRNGTSERNVQTLAGGVTIRKTKVRDTEESFESEILRAWQRRCDELSAMIPGLYLEGLSTRDFKRACGVFWGEAGLSRSTISRLNKRLHEEFAAWRQRDLSEEGLVFLYLDAHYAGVRFGTGEKEAVLVAHGIRKDGSRSVLSIQLGGRESTASWAEVLHDLDQRGLPRALLVISDGNPGLIRAVKDVWPDLPRQRCVEHRTRNILDKVPKSKREEVRKALMAIWHADHLEAAGEAAKAFVRKYGQCYEAATECLLECLSDCLTFFRFPENYWKRIRTSNPLERTFKEVRRRTRVVGRFPTEGSALAVIYGILTIEGAKWRGMKFTPTTIIELREVSEQLKADPITLDIEREAA
jgi:transposase-like protein